MIRSSWYICCLIALLCCHVIDSKILVQQRNGTQFELTAVEIIFIKSSSQQRITDPVILPPTLNQGDVNGKMYVMNDAFSNDAIIANMQAKGALAAIVVSFPWKAGFLRFRWTDQRAVNAIQIPIFEITRAESAILWPLIEQGEVANITLVPTDEPNPWDTVLSSPGYHVYMAFLMTFEATNMALAIWKVKLFVDFYGGFKVSFAMAVLSLEIVSNLMSNIDRVKVSKTNQGNYVVQMFGNLDIFGANGIYNEIASWVLYHLSFPFVLSAIMLFSLYWHEIMTSSSIVVYPFIVKMRIPFFFVAGILVLLELALILVGIYSVGEYTNFAMYAYLPVAFILVVYYLVTGYKLLQRLNGSKKKGRKMANLKQATIRIMISVGFLLIMLLIGALFLTPFGYDPLPYVMIWCSLYLAIDCTSLMNIIAFAAPSKAKTSQSGSSGGNMTTNVKAGTSTVSIQSDRSETV